MLNSTSLQDRNGGSHMNDRFREPGHWSTLVKDPSKNRQAIGLLHHICDEKHEINGSGVEAVGGQTTNKTMGSIIPRVIGMYIT